MTADRWRRLHAAVKTLGAYIGVGAMLVAAYAGLVNVDQNRTLARVQEDQQHERVEADLQSCQAGNTRVRGIRNGLVDVALAAVVRIRPQTTAAELEEMRAEAYRLLAANEDLADRDCSTIPGIDSTTTTLTGGTP